MIYNPIAGRHPARREKEIQQAANILKHSNLDVGLAPTSGPGDAEHLARRAAQGGVDLVLVCGGDGTINEVINGLALKQIPLGILPGGTANILGKELRLPHNPDRAATELAGWSPRRIALGLAKWQLRTPESNLGPPTESLTQARRYFISVAGIGFDAHIVYKLSSQMKMSWGVVGYIAEALRQALRYHFPQFSSRMDGREHRATFAVIHRTRLYAGWLHLAPTASLFEPRFTVCAFPSRSTARYFLYASAVLARQHLRLRDVDLADARDICCTPAEPGETIRFELDGELVGALPATFEIVPDALTLLVPPAAR